ncbi:hypothetical protein VTI74DRAFT_178 [Chaetomium olivicolor]
MRYSIKPVCAIVLVASDMLDQGRNRETADHWHQQRPLNDTSYLWMIIVELNCPPNNIDSSLSKFQSPSSGPRRIKPHALVTGFKPSTTQTAINGVGVYTLSPPTRTSGPVAYVVPAPPVEKPPHAHRYVSLLYETAADFTLSRSQVDQTLEFNLAELVGKVGLGAPVRARWFNNYDGVRAEAG